MANTIYLFDNMKQLIAPLDPQTITVNEQVKELNGLIQHTIGGLYQGVVEKAHFFGLGDVDDANDFLMYKIDNLTADGGSFLLVGTHILFDDLSGRGGIIRNYNPDKTPIRDAFERIVSGTGWRIGDVLSDNTITSEYRNMSKIDAFWDALLKGNVEFEPRLIYEGGTITDKVINLGDKIGGDNGLWYEYGDKFVEIQKEVKSSGIYTAFIGVGETTRTDDGRDEQVTFSNVAWSVDDGDPIDKPAGQDYLVLPLATEKYGFEDGSPRFAPVVVFNDISSAGELLRETYRYAIDESRPKLHLKSSVTDDGVVSLGETVRVIRDDINIRYETRIFKITRDFNNPKTKVFEFGDRLVYRQAERIKKQETALEDLVKNFPTYTPTHMFHVIKHGSNNAEQRPNGANAVYWMGDSVPTMSENGDLLYLSDSEPKPFYIGPVTEPGTTNRFVDNFWYKSPNADYENFDIVNYNPDTTEPVDYLFAGIDEIIHFKGVRFTRAPSADYMFINCSELRDAGVIRLDSAVSTVGLFRGCANLTSVVLRLGSTQDTRGMFEGCVSLERVLLPGLGEGAEPGDFINRTINVSDSNMSPSALEELAHSLGTMDVEFPYNWRLIYKDGVSWDTSIATVKGWTVVSL